MAQLKSQTERYREGIDSALFEKLIEVADPTDPQGKRRALVYKQNDVHSAVWGTPIPEPSTHEADLLTPGRVLLWVACPLCGQRSPMSVYLDGQLTVTNSGRELKPKATTKGTNHICGQTVMDAPSEEAEGQLDIGEALDDDDEEPSEPA